MRFQRNGAAAALLVYSILATACVHTAAGNRTSSFTRKTQSGSDPLKDDSRIQSLEAEVRANPKNLAARLELAGLYEGYHAFDQALSHYTEILLAEGPNVSDEVTSGLRRASEGSGRSTEAIPFLEAFLKTSPSANAWNDLALLYDGVGNHAAGEKALREALDLNAESVRFHNNLGYNLELQNRLEDAEQEYRSALTLNPEFAAARNNLGALLGRRGNVAGALEQFNLAGDAAAAHNNLAVVLIDAGLYEQSREELMKALEIRQQFAPALENLKLVQERLRERASK